MKIANVSELKDGVNEVFAGAKKYFIYKNGVEVKVYSAVCPHQGAILCFDNSSLGNSNSSLAQDTRIANGLKNAESTPVLSLRGARSEASATKQSKRFASEAKQPSTQNCHIERSEISKKNRDSSLRTSCSAQNNKIDCHDSATQNLAMTENNTDSANRTKNAESNENIAESALDSAPRDEIYCKVHNWRFCAKSGEATNVKNASLSEVAFRIDDLGDIYLDSVKSNKITESNKQNGENIAESAPTSSLRTSEASATKQSTEFASVAKNLKTNIDSSLISFAQNDKIDCHDLTSSNLAMTENNADSTNRTNFAESFTKNPPPVAKIHKTPQFHKTQKIRQISA
ncbi:Rieske 2Fe-2S domain-containing protein [Helicobacter sp. 23-1044]